MTARNIEIEPSLFCDKWISYIDLLGVKELIDKNNWIQVFEVYSDVIEKFTIRHRVTNINQIWFSDTFLVYSSDNSIQSLDNVRALTELFIHRLIFSEIPFTGAMSCGEFYADKDNNLFFGKALIEAHSFGENQNWIGFILCPSAIEQMAINNRPAENMHYAYWKIPYKTRSSVLPDKLPAYILGNSRSMKRNIEKLEKMRDQNSDKKVIKKYKNTLDFISKSERT